MDEKYPSTLSKSLTSSTSSNTDKQVTYITPEKTFTNGNYNGLSSEDTKSDDALHQQQQKISTLLQTLKGKQSEVKKLETRILELQFMKETNENYDSRLFDFRK